MKNLLLFVMLITKITISFGQDKYESQIPVVNGNIYIGEQVQDVWSKLNDFEYFNHFNGGSLANGVFIMGDPHKYNKNKDRLVSMILLYYNNIPDTIRSYIDSTEGGIVKDTLMLENNGPVTSIAYIVVEEYKINHLMNIFNSKYFKNDYTWYTDEGYKITIYGNDFLEKEFKNKVAVFIVENNEE